MSADATCAICGRTILAGERVHGFVEALDERCVCELCLAKAEGLGWRPAGEPEPERAAKRHEGRGRLRGLLHRRTRRPGVPTSLPSSPVAPQSPVEPGPPDPAGPPRRLRPAPPLDSSAPSPSERAVARFNSSEAGRAVRGLVRTLGAPWVSVGTAAGAPSEVRITVAWEVSWYQWGVDVGDELRPVFQIDKGGEVGQLDAAARQWNASVGVDGRLNLQAPRRRGAGRPAPQR